MFHTYLTPESFPQGAFHKTNVPFENALGNSGLRELTLI